MQNAKTRSGKDQIVFMPNQMNSFLRGKTRPQITNAANRGAAENITATSVNDVYHGEKIPLKVKAAKTG
jgi:hypothetical protein